MMRFIVSRVSSPKSIFAAFLIERLGAVAFLEHIYKPKEPLSEKIKQVFHETPEEFEKDFINWVRSR